MINLIKKGIVSGDPYCFQVCGCVGGCGGGGGGGGMGVGALSVLLTGSPLCREFDAGRRRGVSDPLKLFFSHPFQPDGYIHPPTATPPGT